MITLKSYLCGQWQQGTGKPATLINPATEEPVAETSTEGLDLAGALAYGREKGGPALRAMTFAERGKVLKGMSKALHGAREALIEASIENGGTTRSDAKFDIDGAIGTLAHYAGLGKQLGDRTFLVEGEGEQLTGSPRFWGHHVRTPMRGVAVHINAFNFPAWGLAEKASCALLAGVPVVSKPATATALLTFRCMERIIESEVLPEGALQLVCGSPGDMLQHLGPQDMLSFTGSGNTGSTLRGLQNIVDRSVRVNVEADSLNAAVLTGDVEPGSDAWAMFIRDVVREMTQKTGQKCTATRRIFAPRSLIDRVQEELSEELGRIQVGNPAHEEVRMGPVATRQQLDDVRAGIDKLVSSGAQIVFGSATDVKPVGVPEGKGFFVSPVLLRAEDAASATAVHEHEVFGPVATVMPYDDTEEVVGHVARGEGGLVTSVYGDDKKALQTLILGLAPYNGRVLVGSKKVADQATPPGMVLPNCVHGGPGRAGGGEELGGLRGLNFYTQRTAVQGDRALLDRLLDVKTKE
jgi:oxepin-CoA hydrolase/3-oxo-5,6-dehydrosuberyl-CoA semialdehyde dehydrogenase